jgi:hypothetical protein
LVVNQSEAVSLLRGISEEMAAPATRPELKAAPQLAAKLTAKLEAWPEREGPEVARPVPPLAALLALIVAGWSGSYA